MAYFLVQDHQALTTGHGHSVNGSADYQRAYNKLLDLHNTVYPRLRNHNLDLHPRWQKTSVISQESAAALEPSTALVLPYFRSREQAEVVEQCMGITEPGGVDTYRHPVIELRLTPEYFAVELILSPYAWWDQQNFIGKLELSHHRATFRSYLQEMQGDYCFGFWQGLQLSEMHLTNADLRRGKILDEWMDTFDDGHDWLRIGRWYEPEAAELRSSSIQNEIFDTIKMLNKLYSFLLWTSNNNFQSFYDKRQQFARRYA